MRVSAVRRTNATRNQKLKMENKNPKANKLLAGGMGRLPMRRTIDGHIQFEWFNLIRRQTNRHRPAIEQRQLQKSGFDENCIMPCLPFPPMSVFIRELWIWYVIIENSRPLFETPFFRAYVNWTAGACDRWPWCIRRLHRKTTIKCNELQIHVICCIRLLFPI